MANRKRAIQIKFTVNEEEKKLIEQRQELSGIKNKGAFYRKMLIDGVVVNTDLSAIKEGRVYADDLKDIDKKVEEIWQLLKSTLLSQQ